MFDHFYNFQHNFLKNVFYNVFYVCMKTFSFFKHAYTIFKIFFNLKQNFRIKNIQSILDFT